MTQGVLVAADEKIEWLLPWWWARYSAHNSFPVCFVDFGMSYFGKTFCQERGSLLSLEETPLQTHPTQASPQASLWEENFGKGFWEYRKSWFKKPFAFLMTPFKRTLWLDLDCEVLASLAPLFALEGEFILAQETEACLQRERGLQIIYSDEMLYNSGVILFDQIPLLNQWAQTLVEQGEQFWTDQHALSRIIYQDKVAVQVLSEHFNWRMSQGLNLQAVIIHWAGSWGKEYIRLYGGIGEELAKLSFSL